MKKHKCLLVGVMGAFVILATVAVLFPVYCDYTARAALNDSLQKLIIYRDKIAMNGAERWAREGSGAEVKISAEAFPTLNIDYARVLPDGTIIIRHAKYHQIVVLEPSMTEGKVSWRCIGGPLRDVPTQCR